MSREIWERIISLSEDLKSGVIVVPHFPSDNVNANMISKLLSYEYGKYADAIIWAGRVINVADRMNKLFLDPQPGLSTWHEAVNRVHKQLDKALRGEE